MILSIGSFQENGISYYQLYTSCPVCWGRGITTPLSKWLHYDNNCYGDIYVGENAYYKCKKCGQSVPVLDWRVNCPTHLKSLAYYVGESCLCVSNLAGIVRTLGMTDIAGIPWVQRFVANLEKHVPNLAKK